MPEHKFYPITCQFQGGPTLVFYETRDTCRILLETVERVQLVNKEILQLQHQLINVNAPIDGVKGSLKDDFKNH